MSMVTQDCAFVASFYINFTLWFICFAGLLTTNWVEYSASYDWDGYLGLWADCLISNRTGQEDCDDLPKGEGPGFLEATRTCTCLAVVAYFIGVFGYIISDHATNDAETCLEKLKMHLQEIGYFLAGVLCIISAIIYGINYYDHYEDKEDKNLGFSYYFIAVCGGLSTTLSIVMFCSRDSSGTRAEKSKKIKIVKAPSTTTPATKANVRKDWIVNPKIVTPSIQKKEKEGETTDNKETMVEVKKGFTKSIVAPTQVILAMQRLKRGRKKKEDTTLPVRAPTPETDTRNKYKGIFSVQADNKQKPEEETVVVIPPPVLIPPKKTRSLSSSSDSSTGSSTDISVVDTKGGKHVNFSTQEKDTLQRPTQPRRHFSQSEAALRENAARNAVVVTDEVGKGEARKPPGPSLKRHHTQQDQSLRQAAAFAVSEEKKGGKINIYAIPAEPGHMSPDNVPIYEY